MHPSTRYYGIRYSKDFRNSNYNLSFHFRDIILKKTFFFGNASYYETLNTIDYFKMYYFEKEIFEIENNALLRYFGTFQEYDLK